MMVQISDHCTAACCHCPYSHNNRFFSQTEIVLQAANTTEGFVTLTGGEPLEHPNFLSICKDLEEKGIPFRVATGGHVLLANILDQLSAYHGFLGFNMGSDVMSSRNSNFKLKQTWWQNIVELRSRGISWSLTLTIGDDVDFTGIICDLQNNSITPDFLMINEKMEGMGTQSLVRTLEEGPWKNLSRI